MWLTLLLAVLVGIAVLYVPGYLVARSFAIARFASVAIAPLLSIFVSVALGVALEKIGLACAGPVLFASVVAVSLIAFLASKGIARVKGGGAPQNLISVGDAREACKFAALYVGVALAVSVVVFFLAIDGPESFSRNDDTTFHLSAVRTFLETGTFSTLNVSSYLDQGVAGGFYPAAWHVVTAMIASFFGNAVPLAANASVAVLLVFVFPLAMCLLFMKLFSDNRRIILAGSLFVLAFCGFPWMFMVFGQLFSNMTSFILIPPTLVLLVEAIEAPRRSDKVKLALLVGAGLVSIALSQPNGAFTFGIWAVLYCINRMFYPVGSHAAKVTPKRIAAAVALFAVAAAVWTALFFAPFLQTIVQYTWEAKQTPLKAIAYGLLFMFTERGGVQPFLSIVVLAGVLYTLRNRRYLWLTCAFAFAMLAFVIDASTDGIAKQFLTGFWYTDRYRTGAMAAFFAIPLAALGFAQVVGLLARLCAKLGKKTPEDSGCMRLAVGIGLALFAVCQFLPVHVQVTKKADIYSGLVAIHREVSTRYSWERGLTSEEDAFVKQVMQTVPEGALVINVPSDGSCWSYGVEGLNTYFRRSSNNGLTGLEDSKILRAQLRDIENSQEVQNLVDQLDARYLLMLDESSGDDRTTTSLRYKEDDWRGIESINEQTPGFTLVLSEGDMRLYEIDR